MWNRIYLLSVRELAEGEADRVLTDSCLMGSGESILWKRICGKLDAERLGRVRAARNAKKRAACAGAGLLLQWALRQAPGGALDMAGGPGTGSAQNADGISETDGSPASSLMEISLTDILDGIQEPLPLRYTYNHKGKPFLLGSSLYFNLSHSGEYVVCALSECEIGVDIQRQAETDSMRLANRFYHPHERELLAAIPTEEGRRDFFYRLWTRKEAYGKMTGEGVAPVIGRDFASLDVEWMKGIHWEEYDIIGGCKIACCRRNYDNR